MKQPEKKSRRKNSKKRNRTNKIGKKKERGGEGGYWFEYS